MTILDEKTDNKHNKHLEATSVGSPAMLSAAQPQSWLLLYRAAEAILASAVAANGGGH